MSKSKEFLAYFGQVAAAWGVILLWLALAVFLGDAGNIVLLLSLGGFSLGAIVWYYGFSSIRAVNGVLNQLQMQKGRPVKQSEKLRRWLMPGPQSIALSERLLAWPMNNCLGVKKIGRTAEGEIVYQIWTEDEQRAFLLLRRLPKGRQYRVVRLLLEGEGDVLPSMARPSGSLYRHGKTLGLLTAALSVALGFLGYTGFHHLANREYYQMRTVARLSVQAMADGKPMAASGTAEVSGPFYEAVADLTNQLIQKKAAFEDALERQGYAEALTAQALKADREQGLSNIVFTLEYGRELAKEYYADLEALLDPAYIRGVLDRHHVEASQQALYFEKIRHFDAGNTALLAETYQDTVERGRFLQEHLDAWSVDEEGNLLFSDEALLKDYNALVTAAQIKAREALDS